MSEETKAADPAETNDNIGAGVTTDAEITAESAPAEDASTDQDAAADAPDSGPEPGPSFPDVDPQTVEIRALGAPSVTLVVSTPDGPATAERLRYGTTRRLELGSRSRCFVIACSDEEHEHILSEVAE